MAGGQPASSLPTCSLSVKTSTADELEVFLARSVDGAVADVAARHARRRIGAAEATRSPRAGIIQRIVGRLPIERHCPRGAGNQHRGGEEGDDRLHCQSPLWFGARLRLRARPAWSDLDDRNVE